MTATTSMTPGRFLHEQLSAASRNLLRKPLTTFIYALMSAEADAVCGAPYGASSPDRTNQRNGYSHRDFSTRAGTIDLAFPQAPFGFVLPGLVAGAAQPG
ncbi:transposase-like protein [Actinopolymorpha rutila]|uniref:Transposase-like protein n=1 Tax=Actinopolymorpha rutila TaxID=446787 RepID=A0A852ZD48_9ACTN|nr:transposase-like protein [Actinopolymorpha rutila]